MRLDHLWLVDFRNYISAELRLPPGLLAVTGDNGAGKTNLLEAVGYLASQSSFRGVGNEALVRSGAGQAVVRGQGRRGERALLLEAEIRPAGRNRMTINRQPLRRTGDLADALRVTVFSPDDLELVKAGPTGRRRFLDDVLATLHPRHDANRREFERVVRQRNALLAQVAGTRGPLREDIASTLDVWDARFVQAGEAVGTARTELVGSLEPVVAKTYAHLANAMTGLRGPNAMTGLRGPNAMTGLRGPHDPHTMELSLQYHAPWRERGLAAALAAARTDELRRGTSLVGPHRDELLLDIGGMPARTHASQGEQRSLALALRLAAHNLVTEQVGEPPLLLLDDVFSELDAQRTEAVLEHLPAGQSVLTTAGPMPPGVSPDAVVRVSGGRLA